MGASPADVAGWMVGELRTSGVLDQRQAVHQIRARFGERFARFNPSGSVSINRDVLRRFRTELEDAAIWEPGLRRWRLPR